MVTVGVAAVVVEALATEAAAVVAGAVAASVAVTEVRRVFCSFASHSTVVHQQWSSAKYPSQQQ